MRLFLIGLCWSLCCNWAHCKGELNYFFLIKHLELCLNVFNIKFGLLKSSSQWREMLKVESFEICISTHWEAVVYNLRKPDFPNVSLLTRKLTLKRQITPSFSEKNPYALLLGVQLILLLLAVFTHLYNYPTIWHLLLGIYPRELETPTSTRWYI